MVYVNFRSQSLNIAHKNFKKEWHCSSWRVNGIKNGKDGDNT